MKADHGSASWLVLFFGRQLSLGWLPDHERPVFSAEGLEYKAVDADFLPTLHDRLVDDHGRLLGIRIWPVSASASEFLESLPRTGYMTLGNGFVDVWLSEAPVYGAGSTGDQAFGARIYKSGLGAQVALALDIDYICLSDADRASIEGASARWVSVA